jgi:hypothetical protein
MRLTPAQKRNLAFVVIRKEFPGAISEYRFHEKRKWRFDYAWPEKMIALEYEGGIFTRGGHVRGAHYDSDCEKYNTAAILGWVVIRVTPVMLRDGRAMNMLDQAHRRAVCP